MKIFNNGVLCHSDDEEYQEEKSDLRNWTFRVVSKAEHKYLMSMEHSLDSATFNITIRNNYDGDEFTRTIRHIKPLGLIAGKYVVGITWEEQKNFML